jgi:hypothetical protein
MLVTRQDKMVEWSALVKRGSVKNKRLGYFEIGHVCEITILVEAQKCAEAVVYIDISKLN